MMSQPSNLFRLRFRRIFVLLSLLAVGLGSVSACKSAPKEDPILRLSAAESLEQGKAFMAEEKYARARPYLSHAFEVEPNSLQGREALLLVADAYYLQGNSLNLIKAEAKYRDFLNRFPTSDRAPYVQFQIGNTLAQRMERPDRDQQATFQALEAFRTLLRLYPTSEYAAQAQEKVNLVRSHLAESEVRVGQFYLRYRIPTGAVERFEHVLDEYPEYRDLEKVLYQLGVAYAKMRKPDKARETFDRLSREYPGSPYLSELPELPESAPEASEQNQESTDAEEVAG